MVALILEGSKRKIFFTLKRVIGYFNRTILVCKAKHVFKGLHD